MADDPLLNAMVVGEAPEDNERIRAVLSAAPGFGRVELCDSIAHAIERLPEALTDVVLLSVETPDYFGPHSIRKLVELAPQIAVVMWAGRARERDALEAVSLGAWNVVVKGIDDGDRLPGLLSDSVGQQRTNLLLKVRMEVAGLVKQTRADWYWETGPDFRFTWISDRFVQVSGLDKEDLLGRTPWEADSLDHDPVRWIRLKKDFEDQKPVHALGCRYLGRDGRPRAFRISGRPGVDAEGRFAGYGGIGLDATIEVETSLRAAEAYESLTDAYEELAEFRTRLQGDLKVATAMQKELQPHASVLEELEQSHGVRVTAHFEASVELGGDIWGLEPVDENRVVVWVSDFSGHGVASALNTFRLHAMIEEIGPGADDPAAFIGVLNGRLKDLLPTGQYATMVYGVVDLENDVFTYAAAAAPRPLVGTRQGGVEVGDGSGLPLGVAKAAPYRNRTLRLPEDGVLFLYSDALIEEGRDTGDDLGKDGVVDLFAGVVDGNGPDSGVEAVLAPFFEKVPGPYSDDLTAVTLCRLR